MYQSPFQEILVKEGLDSRHVLSPSATELWSTVTAQLVLSASYKTAHSARPPHPASPRLHIIVYNS